jgi:hypothetical protein
MEYSGAGGKLINESTIQILPQLDSERKDLSAYIISTSCIVIGQAAT